MHTLVRVDATLIGVDHDYICILSLLGSTSRNALTNNS